MDQQEALEWAERQDVVKISCVKNGEEDKYIFTVGQYNVSPLIFDTQEEAEEYMRRYFKFTNLDLAIIGAMCQRLSELNNQQPNNEEK